MAIHSNILPLLIKSFQQLFNNSIYLSLRLAGFKFSKNPKPLERIWKIVVLLIHIINIFRINFDTILTFSRIDFQAVTVTHHIFTIIKVFSGTAILITLPYLNQFQKLQTKPYIT